jgi:predicted nucleic acid-binding protein
VVDASVALAASSSPRGFDTFAGEDLVAPPLLWSEFRSVLHETLWRGEVSLEQALRTLARLDDAPIQVRSPPQLGGEAWRIADELGWAKTYDTEYLALAALLGCRLVTDDARLRRRAGHLGFVVGPTELHSESQS